MDNKPFTEEGYKEAIEHFGSLAKELEEKNEELKKELEKGYEERIKELPEDLREKYKLDEIPEESEEENPEGSEEENPEEFDEEISQEQFDYVMLELMYLDKFNREPTDDNHDLYPNGWFEDPDYKKQFEILAEAIAENKKIEETKGYGELHKGRCAK